MIILDSKRLPDETSRPVPEGPESVKKELPEEEASPQEAKKTKKEPFKAKKEAAKGKSKTESGKSGKKEDEGEEVKPDDIPF